jgi:hypothetical protein
MNILEEAVNKICNTLARRAVETLFSNQRPGGKFDHRRFRRRMRQVFGKQGVHS